VDARFVRRFACLHVTTDATITPFPADNLSPTLTVQTAVHHFVETIGGRAYQIEVAATDPGRWRAYIVRVPGVPTALMPFYGPTPDAAAANLLEWLSKAHARAAGGAKRTANA